jgi:hypothetical protein
MLNRSLLLFAKGKPLGKKGFEWLKTHCINLTELKKKSPVAERLAYADEVMEDILGRVFSMNLTESLDSDSESLSQTEAIITPLLTFRKTKQFHKISRIFKKEYFYLFLFTVSVNISRIKSKGLIFFWIALTFTYCMFNDFFIIV